MSRTSMDAAAKDEVKQSLLALLREQFAASQESIEEHESAAEVDPDSSHSVDDLSQADAAGGLTALFEESAAKQAADLAAVEALDFSPAKTVRPGTIVGFGGRLYVVGMVADSFEAGGRSFEGISTDSPVFRTIEGLPLGAKFNFRGTDQTIDFLA